MTCTICERCSRHSYASTSTSASRRRLCRRGTTPAAAPSPPSPRPATISTTPPPPPTRASPPRRRAITSTAQQQLSAESVRSPLPQGAQTEKLRAAASKALYRALTGALMLSEPRRLVRLHLLLGRQAALRSSTPRSYYCGSRPRARVGVDDGEGPTGRMPSPTPLSKALGCRAGGSRLGCSSTAVAACGSTDAHAARFAHRRRAAGRDDDDYEVEVVPRPARSRSSRTAGAPPVLDDRDFPGAQPLPPRVARSRSTRTSITDGAAGGRGGRGRRRRGRRLGGAAQHQSVRSDVSFNTRVTALTPRLVERVLVVGASRGSSQARRLVQEGRLVQGRLVPPGPAAGRRRRGGGGGAAAAERGRILVARGR